MALAVLRSDKPSAENAKEAAKPRLMGAPVIGVGARSPLGLTALSVAMTARAHKLDVWLTRFVDRWNRTVGASRARFLPEDLHGFERLVALGAPALREAAAGLTGPLPLYLAVSEPGRPDDDPRMGPELLAELARASGVAIDLERSLVVRSGHAGGGMALDLALHRMRDTAAENRPAAVIVGGLDSYYDGRVLKWLDEDRRLHSSSASDGLFPGEGAAFVVVCASAEEAAQRSQAPPLATILYTGSTREETIGTEEPNVALALTRAVRSAAEGVRTGRIAWALTDVNGERHRIDEWDRVMIRCNDVLGEEVRHDMLPRMLADIGAATGPMALALCAMWFRAGAAREPRALVSLCSEGPERSVFVVEAPPGDAGSLPAEPAARATPAKTASPPLEEAIERVARSAKKLTDAVDRVALEPLLGAALSALARWAKSELLADDHLERLTDAAARTAAARAALEAISGEEIAAAGAKMLRHVETSLAACREQTIHAIVAEQDLSRRGPAPQTTARAPLFRAGIGAPVVHATEREAPLPLTGARFETRTPEEAALAVIARDVLEDIGILGGLRRPNEDEPWTRSGPFEDRLLADVDALASLDRAVNGPDLGIDTTARALAYSTEASWADTGRAFTRAFALSCFGAEDAVRAATAGLATSHPITHAAQRDAFCLAPSAEVVPAMERLLWHDDSALVRLAIFVLRFRRAATLPAMLPLLSHPDVGVLEAAARAMATVEPRPTAIAALRDLLREGVEDRVAIAALESLVLLGDPSALETVATRLRDDAARPGTLGTAARLDLLRLLAVAGAQAHSDLLVGALAKTPSAVTAVGYYGHPTHVEAIVGVLAKANEQRHPASIQPTQLELDAARALLRITGIYLEDPDEPSGVGLAMKASLWREHFIASPLNLHEGTRYRFGEPYRPAAALAELKDEATAPHARIWTALELSVLAGQGWGFEPLDWVARQKQQIALMEARIESGIGYEAGEWPESYRARRRALSSA